MTTAEYSPSSGTSGFVNRVDAAISSYFVSTGFLNCDVQYRDVTATGVLRRKHAMFQFDTSALSGLGVSSSNITYVEMQIIEDTTQGVNPPLGYDFYMGSWIGGTLDNTNAEWGGGTYVTSETSFTSGNYYYLAGDGNLIDVSGTTDVAIWVTSGLQDVNYTRDFNTSKTQCKLRITYSIGGVKDVITCWGIIPFSR